MNKEKWIYIKSDMPYVAIASTGITLDTSFILNVPHLNWDTIEEYKYLADNEDNAELDAIVVSGVGAIINRETLKHNAKNLDTLLK